MRIYACFSVRLHMLADDCCHPCHAGRKAPVRLCTRGSKVQQDPVSTQIALQWWHLYVCTFKHMCACSLG